MMKVNFACSVLDVFVLSLCGERDFFECSECMGIGDCFHCINRSYENCEECIYNEENEENGEK